MKLREERLWERADELISEKDTKSYDFAVRILAVLKLLRCHEGKWESYLEGVVGLKERYPRLSGFHQRMESAYLYREDDKPSAAGDLARNGFDEEVFGV